MKTQQREKFFDVSKGICILFVTTVHLDWFGAEKLLLFPYWIGMAVPVFMIISGYLYTKSAQKAGIQTMAQAYAPSRIGKEILRFFVPFTLMFFLEQILERIQGGGKPLRRYIAAYFNGGAGPGSYYYAVMLEFVFVFPLIFAVVRHSKWGLIQCFFINAAYDCMGRIWGLTDGLYRMLVFRYIFVIAFGCSLALGNLHIRKPVKVASCFVGAVHIFLFYYAGWPSYIDYGWTTTNFISVLYVLPIFEFFYDHRANVHCKVLEVIGKASFDVFLVQKVYMIYHAAIWQRLIGEMPNPIIQMLAAIPVCAGCGILFYHLETSVFRWMMSIWDTAASRFPLKAIERFLFERE